MGMSTKSRPVGSWHESPVRNTGEVRRWKSLISFRSLALGVDEQGNWLQFVPQTGSLIPATSENMLFFLPLLDMEYPDFASQVACATENNDRLRESADDLIQKVVRLALQQRAPSYIERALSWLEHLAPNDDTRKALEELARSRRGTQRLRHSAFSILRRHGTQQR